MIKVKTSLRAAHGRRGNPDLLDLFDKLVDHEGSGISDLGAHSEYHLASSSGAPATVVLVYTGHWWLDSTRASGFMPAAGKNSAACAIAGA
jgi:hypothetical protein